MKVNKFKSLALGLAISAVSSAAMAASATLTTIDVPYAWQSMNVSDHGQISYYKMYSIGSPIRTRVYTWSVEDGETLLDEIPEQHYGIGTSGDGSRTTVFTGENGAPTHVYTNDVEQLIPSSAFFSRVMSDDGKTLGGRDAANQPAVMDIDTGLITTISIPASPLVRGDIMQISDDGQTLLIDARDGTNNLLRYLVDRSGNVKATLPTRDTIYYFAPTDMSGDGQTIAFQGARENVDGCAPHYSALCIDQWVWNQSTGMKKFEINQMVNAKLNYNGTIRTIGNQIWDNVAGTRNLISALQAKGVDTSGWTNMGVVNISSNGKYLVGEGYKNGTQKRFLIENNAEPICTVPAF